MKAVGRHVILELWGCTNLDSVEIAERTLRELVTALGITLLDLKVYASTGGGVTGIAIISESHLAIHTWPQYAYAAVDVFTCGPGNDPDVAMRVLRDRYKPAHVQMMEVVRGQTDDG
jgi:S-adenosylmethionine decarboxylase